ncbi:uncharacterized protein LOC116193043 [Punica granatum]|uniref:DUF538 domain-containing protein n=2 Tax=Punica granatum TaxID=22663 RepID=A0A218XA29_PUNGR|nr:uncharacterized protein LOC116193043 [Punica granatum]OWM81222.1 hypothetical protein CDL15_Pgr007253 [Punica granatum]PKI33733.1 hypothetical protein CRG98_045874 [Punica granatum]
MANFTTHHHQHCPSTLLRLLLVLLLSLHPPQSSASSTSSSASIHDLLRSKGLPGGLLPKAVRSYSFSREGLLEVYLDGPCLTRFESRVYFESVVKANLTYGSLTGVVGLTQEELFLWLPVKGIIVDDPNSGLILFDIGVALKQMSLSLFEDQPDCKAHHQDHQGVLKNHVRKEKGFEGLR